jgi:hypothetical protein
MWGVAADFLELDEVGFEVQGVDKFPLVICLIAVALMLVMAFREDSGALMGFMCFGDVDGYDLVISVFVLVIELVVFAHMIMGIFEGFVVFLILLDVGLLTDDVGGSGEGHWDVLLDYVVLLVGVGRQLFVVFQSFLAFFLFDGRLLIFNQFGIHVVFYYHLVIGIYVGMSERRLALLF